MAVRQTVLASFAESPTGGHDVHGGLPPITWKTLDDLDLHVVTPRGRGFYQASFMLGDLVKVKASNVQILSLSNTINAGAFVDDLFPAVKHGLKHQEQQWGWVHGNDDELMALAQQYCVPLGLSDSLRNGGGGNPHKRPSANSPEMSYPWLFAGETHISPVQFARRGQR